MKKCQAEIQETQAMFLLILTVTDIQILNLNKYWREHLAVKYKLWVHENKPPAIFIWCF